jgi:16S rRNA (cytosine967-C5)-methyltransferase
VVKPGGRLLYTSCSVLAAENERVVAAFLARTPAAQDLTPGLTVGWPARPSGAGPGYQVLPGEIGMDGFYYACVGKPL